MSDYDDFFKACADWARAEKNYSKQGKLLVLNKNKIQLPSLEDVKARYDKFDNIQFIRVSERILLAKKQGMVKLVALHTNESCTVGGKHMRLGDEYTIEAGQSVHVTPQGEFLFVEKAQ